MRPTALVFALLALPAVAHTRLECIGLGGECANLAPVIQAAPAQLVLTDGSEAPAVKDVAQSESLLLKVLAALLTILTPLLTALVVKGTTWLHAQGKASKLAYAGSVVGDLVLSGLAHFKNELEPALQEALKDGVLDAQERANLKAKLMEMLKKDLPADVLKVAQQALGPAFETWLSGQAERAIDAATTRPASP